MLPQGKVRDKKVNIRKKLHYSSLSEQICDVSIILSKDQLQITCDGRYCTDPVRSSCCATFRLLTLSRASSITWMGSNFLDLVSQQRTVPSIDPKEGKKHTTTHKNSLIQSICWVSTTTLLEAVLYSVVVAEMVKHNYRLRNTDKDLDKNKSVLKLWDVSDNKKGTLWNQWHV